MPSVNPYDVPQDKRDHPAIVVDGMLNGFATSRFSQNRKWA
jgi:hypothetical protein